jgi:hypothetical protein
MDNFLSILIVGILASLLIEAINKVWGLNSPKAKVVTIGVSIVFGGLYYFLKDTIWWQTILGVLGTASTIYAFFLKKE